MTSYDFVVVGAGSSGAALAGRLSEDPEVRVLLLEAGGSHRHSSVQIPAAFSKQFKTKRDWELYSEPEPQLNGRSLYYPRAKMLGGCSSMNAMVYIRGNREDYDAWAKEGATGWSYDDLLPLFRRSEDNARGQSHYHGVGGPLHVQDLRSPSDVSHSILEAMVQAGFQRNEDLNGADQLGVAFNQVTQSRGQRWTSADAFLTPARHRKNLEVLTDAHVLRVRVEGHRAIGVDVERDGRLEFLRAEREVILSAGAVNTPQLLMLSGIGPGAHLAEHGIPTFVDNPHVGSHLMEHPFYLANFETTAKGTLFGAESPRHVANYLVRKRGPLTSNVAEISGFVSTRSGETLPDMQILGAPAFFYDNGFATHDKPAITLALSMVAPVSEGSVRLRSRNPKDKVALSLNLFAERADLESMVSAIELAREIVAAPALRDVIGPEIHPGSVARTRTEIEREVREGVQHTFHASSTARIGSEETGVVDAELRVHGVGGLRVADASVFPVIPRGNTHAPAVMVGEKAADLIRAAS